MHIGQHIIDDTELRVQQPVPCHACNDDGHKPRNKDTGPEYGSALKLLVQQNCSHHTHQVFTQHGKDSPVRSVFHCLTKMLICQYLLEIGHPGKTGHRFVDQMHMVKRVVYYFPKGIRDQKSQENKRGKQHDNSCPPFPLVSGKLLKFVQL